MRIPRFWALGRCDGPHPLTGKRTEFSAWGWSFTSAADAADNAQQRANRIVERLGAGQLLTSYGYFDRPIREEVESTIHCNGEEIGIITRNQYGALVLNSSRVLFADIDFPLVIPRGFWDAMTLAFSRRFREVRERDLEQAVWHRIRGWAQANPHRSFRLYRTARGMRFVVTDRSYDPVAADATTLLEELGSDPLYCRLTKVQECFRARLTPKPWRCGHVAAPHRFPRLDGDAQKSHFSWQQEYAKRSKGYRACELVGEFGSPASDEVILQTIRTHDERSCLPDGAPLA